jgi:formylmethanofuran dehydrogenase subunit E
MQSWDDYQDEMERQTRYLPVCTVCGEKCTEYAYKVENGYMCQACWDEYVTDEIRVDLEDWGADEW